MQALVLSNQKRAFVEVGAEESNQRLLLVWFGRRRSSLDDLLNLINEI